MDGIVTLLTQPIVILLVALALLAARIIFHARRLRSVASDPELAKLLSQGKDENLLNLHRTSLNEAKGIPAESLTSGRRLLRSYKRVFNRFKPHRN